MAPAPSERRARTVTVPLAALTAVLVIVAVVQLPDVATGNLGVAAALLLAMVVSHWLPISWFGVDDASHTISVGGLWLTAAAVLLPAPIVVVIGAAAQTTGWAFTCLLGNGVHRPPFNLTAGVVNGSIGAVAGAAAALAAAPFDSTVIAASAAGAATVVSGSLIVAIVDSHMRGGSLLRSFTEHQRQGIRAAVLEIAGAIVVTVCVAAFGPWGPAAVGTVIVVLAWRQAATLHHHRTVTAALLDLSIAATSATTASDVRRMVSTAGREILGRDVALTRAEATSSPLNEVVASEPVGTTGWVLVVGRGTLGRPFRAGPREQRALSGLAAAADVALLAARSREQFRTQAIHDDLTGLLNRRGFDEEGARILRRATRDARPTTVAYVDLNGFKRVNDELGHDTGDAVLVAVADALDRNLRPGDVAGRLGGDEFAVVFGAELPEAMARRRVEEALANLPHGVDGAVGTAQGTADLDALVHRADQRMYEAKRAAAAETGQRADRT